MCTLVSPSTLSQAVSKGTAVTFTTMGGASTSGGAYSTYASTVTSIKFTYPVADSRVQPTASQCYVGGLPTSSCHPLNVAGDGGGPECLIFGRVAHVAPDLEVVQGWQLWW